MTQPLIQMPRIIKNTIFLVMLPLAILAVAIPFISCKQEELPKDTGASGGAPDNFKNPFGIYSAGNLESVPPSSRQIMMEALGVNSYGAFQDFNIEAMREAGVGWIRVDFEFDGNSFTEPSDYLERVRTSGLEVIACARPIKGFAVTDVSLSSLRAGLRQLVERYPWIKIWQVGNEPHIAMANPGDFPRFFLAGSQVIREACPGCLVMLGGAATRHPDTEQAKEYYRRMLASIAAQSRDGRPFDIFDVHFYGPAGDEDVLLLSILDFRQILRENGFEGNGLEVWMTETATYTGKPQDSRSDYPLLQTEEDQAAELVRRFVTALGAGLTRVSWARPYENYGYNGFVEDNFYDLTGLIYNGLGQEAAEGIRAGTKKKSWYAYRTLISKVQGYDEIRSLAPGVYEFNFGPGRKPVFVVWDTGTGVRLDQLLPGSMRGSAQVIDMMGNETQRDPGSLPAGPNPVFVEPST